MSVALPPAAIRRRLAAMFYELLLLLGVLAVGFMLPHLIIGLSFGLVLPGALLLLHVFVVLGVYFVWSWRRGGCTLAMQTWRLRIVDTRGQPPALAQLVLRYLLAWPSLLFYGIGLVWALFDRERLFLHERLSGTRIICAPPTTANPSLPAGT